MAKKSMIVKANRPQKFKVREYSRCTRCGRPHAVMAKFGKLARLALPFKADLTETQDTTQPQGPDLRWAINSGKGL